MSLEKSIIAVYIITADNCKKFLGIRDGNWDETEDDLMYYHSDTEEKEMVVVPDVTGWELSEVRDKILKNLIINKFIIDDDLYSHIDYYFDF